MPFNVTISRVHANAIDVTETAAISVEVLERLHWLQGAIPPNVMESESACTVQSVAAEEEPVPSSVPDDSEKDDSSHGTGDGSKDTSQKTDQVQQVCRFYSQGRRCYYGKKCRFLHQRAAGARKDGENAAAQREKEANVSDSQQQSSENNQSGTENHPPSFTRKTAPVKQERARRPCRYFLAGFCAMDDQCRFLHPQPYPLVKDQPHDTRERRSIRPFAPATSRPAKSQEQVKLADLTGEVCKQLRASEITQLTKRFPKDKLIVQEREDGQLTYYRVTVQATDPDWPFDLNELDVMVSFPESYPQEVFTVVVPEDQDLPSIMGRHVQKASEDWLKAKHATNQLMGRVELLFRPYLRWLDRSMEKLFTEGARQLKKDVDLERFGIEFVPYEQLKVTVFKNTSKKSDTPERIVSLSMASGEEAEQEEPDEAGVEEEEEEEEVDETGVGSDGEEDGHRVENIKTRERRRGTEIKLLGLKLGEQTATVAAKQISVTLKCSRCKVDSDLTLNGRVGCSAQCEKCGAGIRAAFRPSMLHHYSDVLGYLDLNAAVPVDLILKDSEFNVVCLNCNKEDTIQNLTYGQNREENCQHCHTKLSIFVEATRFQFIQPETRHQTGAASQYARRYRDPAVQQGKPLPDKGVCKHFKQSHRWLRFPCCGRAYPCDVCHDEDQDHLMELATRMICGYCAKEQPYSSRKPCVGCGGMMTRATFTSHWEGGQGCRNKAKMSRNDRHKYSNTSKTVSKSTNKEKSN